MERKNKKGLSCREVVTRHLRIFVSDGTVNERKEIRRSRITNFRDDKPLCYNGIRAFTLIELLVVVLIIGILAAVALPQYQKAVEKSKVAQAQTMLKSVYQAAKAYKMANGSWPRSFDELVIDIPWTGTNKWAKQNDTSLANQDWAVDLVATAYSDDLAEGVTVGRIAGPYAGAALFMWDKPLSGFSADTIVCGEMKNGQSYQHAFDKAKGAYCKKILGGRDVFTTHTDYFFKLP